MGKMFAFILSKDEDRSKDQLMHIKKNVKVLIVQLQQYDKEDEEEIPTKNLLSKKKQ